ncbi:aminotransferase class V-fold PLP-dependent enzyme, partial [bacterium]|nr:aminotransferase class V-fold PLP-dependent enzyme [bacterium]
MEKTDLSFSFLRDQTVGIDSIINTPFGKRLMVYCDFTASGRCLEFVENYIMQIQRHYANTHTEDDLTGRSMTSILHKAEQTIKESVNAGPSGRIICTGAGSTAAIYKFQQITGIALTSATKAFLWAMQKEFCKNESTSDFSKFLDKHRPVIFVGPYEHHSNELTWRESIAAVERIRLAPDGGIDLEHLEELLQKPEYQNRLRIGSFSAASNVTGMKTSVPDVSRLLHKYNALACFDYAASAPYVKIDMNPDPGPQGGDTSIDAVFISPHKFLGGPGSSGVLVFNEKIYKRELAPSVAGGGTVLYVNSGFQDYFTDIEEREKAGTPGVLQTLKAAMAFEVKETITTEKIEKREHELLKRAFNKWNKNPNIEILGNTDPSKRISIVSFNVKDPWSTYLHPKLETVLLNDLFGIQSRAGCSCAGPYGHTLLNIDNEKSVRYREKINEGYEGIKPGWCRVGFHYTMDDEEANFIIDAIDFIANKGYCFLPLYNFHLDSGSWEHIEDINTASDFSVEHALKSAFVPLDSSLPNDIRHRLYRSYLQDADTLADKLKDKLPEKLPVLKGELEELRYFSFIN